MSNSLYLRLIVCGFFFPDTPGPPYKLEPSDIAKDSLTLSWYEPDEDGGSPITGYWVERYEPDHDRWIRCNKLPIKDTNYRLVGTNGVCAT